MWIDKIWPKFIDKDGKVLSAHTANGWKEQYNRMIRSYLRCSKSDSTEDYIDFVFAFFQNCYHLKDWLKNSSLIANFDSVWKKFTEEYPQMKYCRDICNGTKHYTINRASVDKDFYFFREYNPYSKKEVWYVNFQEKSSTIDDLIKDCIVAWDKFIDFNIN